MTSFTGSDDLRGAEFVDTDLSRARFVGADLSGVVMRGVQVDGADIDAPWLLSDGGSLLVNGVDVTAYVDAELNRRFPGRAEQRAEDPEGLRAAWAALERTWAATLERVAAMPEGTVDVSVDGEWSFAQTLRHLVLATDMWLGKAVLEIEQPFHPLGLLDAGTEADGTTPRCPRRPLRRTTRCSRPGPAGSRWCATSSPPSRRTSWPKSAQPARSRAPRDRPLVSAHDPGGGVGAPPVRRPRPRGDRGEVRRVSPATFTPAGRRRTPPR